jgi:hypothetical protein
MSEFNEEYEFPCGLKVKMNVKTGLFAEGHFHSDLKDVICPLHGKSCNKKK